MESGNMTVWLAAGRGVPILAATLAAVAVGFVSSRSPFMAVAALAVVLLMIFVFSQPYLVLVILLAALPWEGMLAYPTETVTVVKLLGILLIASVSLNAFTRDLRFRAPPAVVAAVAFVLLSAFSLIVSPNASEGVNQLTRYTLLTAFFFVTIQLLDTRERLLTAMRVLVASLGISAVWGLVAFLSGQEPRASGPITEPLEFGYMLAALLPVCAYLISEDRDLRWLWIACFPAMLGATLATLSRGAFFGLLVTLVWLVLSRRIRLGGLLVSVITLFALVFVGQSLWGTVINERVEEKGLIAEKNVASREALWDGAIKMSMDHPLTGVGIGRFGPESVDYVRSEPIVLLDPEAHNAYLEILAESGPFALTAFLAFLGLTWQALVRVRRASQGAGDREGERLAIALQASLLVAIVGAWFLSEQVASPFWVIAGFAAVVPVAYGSAVDEKQAADARRATGARPAPA
jgi:putative inorganic carbon (hco3(-)) transporter